jgi:hypothetical protein
MMDHSSHDMRGDGWADLDGMDDHHAIIAVEREFAGWLVYRGTEGLCHARRHADGAHVRGEDWTDLRDELIREIGRGRTGQH